MKQLRIFMLLLPLAVLAADVHPTSTSDRRIEGAWYGKDPRDQSCLHLQITKVPRAEEKVYSLVGSDRDARSWCQGASRMQGIGVMQPDGLLIASLVFWCMPDAAELEYFHTDALRYDPATDTIDDDEGVTYHRQVLLSR